MTPIIQWRPRASAVGHYLTCLWRAAATRDVDLGNLPDTGDESSAYADLGTCAHFILQDGLRCLYPYPDGTMPTTPAEEAEAAGLHEPDGHTWQRASALWDGDMATTRVKARACAELAARVIPQPPGGARYICEQGWENSFLTGHTDFVCSDLSYGGDLKTTSRKPEGRRIKPTHLAQLACYHNLTKIPRWFILYVDSQHAAWSTLIWVDFSKPDMAFYAEQIHDFTVRLAQGAFLDQAVPVLGDHCHDTWCPHTAQCADRFMPGPGQHYAIPGVGPLKRRGAAQPVPG
jgi:hypothetical protein